MLRKSIEQRPNWVDRVVNRGLQYYEVDGQPYWNEGTYYQFTAKEIDEIEAATQELHGMCLQAVQYVIDHNLFDKFAIPPEFVPYIKQSWDQRHPYIFGRFDLSYDGKSPPKMLEYNADTPTSLPEAAVIQWDWLEDNRHKINPKIPAEHIDQFNSIHEALIKAWAEVKKEVSNRTNQLFTKSNPLYLTGALDTENEEPLAPEDYQNIQYMRDVCEQAGIATETIPIGNIGWNGTHFVDSQNLPIRAFFKLHPWEHLVKNEFGKYLFENKVGVIEAPWKMILSNKALLPVLWEMFPNHSNLLPAYFEPNKIDGAYVKKPLLSREGANVEIITPTGTIKTDGEYGKEGYIYQAFHSLPNFGGNYPVIGSWVTSNRPDIKSGLTQFDRGGTACGIGIREDVSPITANNSRFVPHCFYG
jgi:hypothetical protein